MGAQTSTSKLSAEQKYINEMIQKCGVTSCKNKIGDIDVQASGTGTVSGITITQQCELDSQCIYNAVSEDISKMYADSAAEAAAGLGLSAADVNVQSSQDIRKKQEQDCGVTETDNIIESIKIGASDSGTLENMTVQQLGNAKQQCMFDGFSKSYTESVAKSTSKSSGADLFAMLIPFIIGFGIVIFIFIVAKSTGGSVFSLLTFQLQSYIPSIISWIAIIIAISLLFWKFQ